MDNVRRSCVVAAPKGNRFAVGNKGGGRHSQFNPMFSRRAELAGRAGLTDRELAELFDVSLSAIEKWKRRREDFRNALKIGKAEADSRIERSLYQCAVGYSSSGSRTEIQLVGVMRGSSSTSLVSM